MTKYGTEKVTTTTDDNGSTLSSIKVFYAGDVVKNLVHHRVRVRVSNEKQEMAEFIHFTDDLRKKKLSGKLTKILEDPTTYPSFVIEYPKNDIDGAHFVVLSWTEWSEL